MPEARKVVLIVEDELPLLNAIKTKLEAEGFDTVSARTADEAYNFLKDIKVDLIWLDHYLLGVQNGLNLAVKIKAQKDWKNIPIFVVSNTADPEKVREYLRLGVTKYYPKIEYSLSDIIADIKQTLAK
ncbi:hypothetical protein A2797_00070 [candidate division WWE3 bacterium RIFCSPHIGHO2_01_FULL_48_15]|uniref:Response regulatory domain-containing protein n=1 Tax=candidate division WWE3 bacterium RIFCSPHIGHO2_01_FULL_48_15 TaxID=1802619 RepID=A0A1F4VA90_UNCKA|nr:MAG: hypothetical protein A2797_00070 [candidate division WWE3 bacterium RIFCSPHIGHO2_01_FULL_48_15]